MEQNFFFNGIKYIKKTPTCKKAALSGSLMASMQNWTNAVVCWNCNPTDLAGNGLKHNFNLVREKIGIVHIHDLRSTSYPWKEIFSLLKGADFSGWTLLEEGKVPADIVAAMHENRRVWKNITDA